MASSEPEVSTIHYEPLPSAVEFHNSNARVKALCGPVGSGKSSQAILEFAFQCIESHVPVRGLVLRESFRQLKDSTRETWKDWLPEPISHWVETDKKYLVTIPNRWGQVLTHEMHFRHARREQEASNLLSTEYSFIWLEEPVPAFQMSDGIMGAGLPKGFFTTALMRQRQKGAARYQMILTFNPPSRFHWVYEQFIKPSKEALAKKGFETFRAPPRENEKNLPPNYYDLLAETLDPDQVARFIDGECITLYPGKPVFNEFFEQMHFREELVIVPSLPLILALDFGLTPCCLFCQVTPRGQVRIYREVQLRQSGALDLVDVIREVAKTEFPGMRISRIWGDPAGADPVQTDKSTPFGIIAKGLGVPVHPGEQKIWTRLESVRTRAKAIVDGEPGIIIDAQGCPTLMEGVLGAYRYPQTQQGLIGSRPLKNIYSHLADALQYMCSGEFNVLSGETTRVEIPKGDAPRIPRYDPFKVAVSPRSRRSWMSN